MGSSLKTNHFGVPLFHGNPKLFFMPQEQIPVPETLLARFMGPEGVPSKGILTDLRLDMVGLCWIF